MITRQGVANLTDKVEKLGAETVQLRVERYVCHASIWWTQLEGIVGQAAWACLSPAQRVTLARLRGEYLYFVDRPDVVAPLGAGGGRKVRTSRLLHVVLPPLAAHRRAYPPPPLPPSRATTTVVPDAHREGVPR